MQFRGDYTTCDQHLGCERLSKSFDSVSAVRATNLILGPAGITALIGPNGAGKSTLLNIVTGFVRPDTGHVWLGNRDLTRLAPAEIARLGIARSFQELRLIRDVSVLDNMMLTRPKQRGEFLLGALFRIGVAAEEARNQREAMRWLEFVGLDRKATQMAGELSYGEQKLLTLACCLATEARILLLDEPVAGVHPELAGRILDLLRQLRDDNRLIVFIEHDLAAVRQIAERVIVMDEGRIIADGAPADILGRPDIMEAYVA